jgi:hypothetical protein
VIAQYPGEDWHGVRYLPEWLMLYLWWFEAENANDVKWFRSVWMEVTQ